MDYYSNRLSEKKKAKEDRLTKLSLPLGRPNGQIPNGQGMNNALKTMAGSPKDPNQEPDLEESDFNTVFQNLSKDDGFKSGMSEFATIMKTMQKDMKGLDLPKEILEKKVQQVMQRYMQGSLDADKAALAEKGLPQDISEGMPQQPDRTPQQGMPQQGMPVNIQGGM